MDGDGAAAWSTSVGKSSTTVADGAPTGDGGIVAVGTAIDDADALALHLSEGGDEEWTERFGADGAGEFRAVHETDWGYVAAGGYAGAGDDQRDGLVVGLREDGSQHHWARVGTGDRPEGATALAALEEGRYVLAGLAGAGQGVTGWAARYGVPAPDSGGLLPMPGFDVGAAIGGLALTGGALAAKQRLDRR